MRFRSVAMTWGPFPAYPVLASSFQAVSRSQCTDSMPHWPLAMAARSAGLACSASRLVTAWTISLLIRAPVMS